MTVQTTTTTSTKVNPFLHVDAERIYNPLTDRELLPADPRFAMLEAALRGEAADESLLDEGWIVPADADLSRQHRLKIVSLETLTTCNQKCYFCPVSIDPREDIAMSVEMFEGIVEQLTQHRDTLEAVFLQSYNEPTVDKRFVDFCRTLYAADLPVAVLSNGSGFTSGKVDALMEMGPLRYLCINLSTLDRHRYQKDRGEDHLPVVLRNLDYMKDKPFAQQMVIVVLGTGDDQHRADFESIKERFAGSRFEVQFHIVMDRAGWLDVGLKPLDIQRPLRGCDNVGSRPLQHLHITPQGKCVLCCEDYDENYPVGDLTTHSIDEVLAGPGLAKMRNWIYGIEQAPEDFMCRKCIFARR
jgi:hypothetical protein